MKFYSLLLVVICATPVFGIYPYKDILKNVIYPHAKAKIEKAYHTPQFNRAQLSGGFLATGLCAQKALTNICLASHASRSEHDIIDTFMGKTFRLNYIKMEKELYLHRASRYATLSCIAAWNFYEGFKKSLE